MSFLVDVSGDAILMTCNVATLATNFLFEGGRADLTKSLSMNPAFQVTHSFALGSQAAPSSYNFGAVFANENVCKTSRVQPANANVSFPIDLPARRF